MSAFKITTDICFALLLLLCADSDRRIREIPREFLWGLVLLGILRFGYVIGIGDSPWSCLCAAPLFCVLLIFWNTGQIGGGDVKLMTLMCFFLGMYQTVVAFALTAIFLGAYSVLRVLRNKDKAHTRIPHAPSLALGGIGVLSIRYVMTLI